MRTRSAGKSPLCDFKSSLVFKLKVVFGSQFDVLNMVVMK